MDAPRRVLLMTFVAIPLKIQLRSVMMEELILMMAVLPLANSSVEMVVLLGLKNVMTAIG